MYYTIHRYETVTSTNDIAARMAEDGAPEGTVVVADEQVAGRGRRGRYWVSPPGDGLYLSVLLRPGIPSDRFWQLAFVASLAAAEAIRQVSHVDTHIKWPNDVLIRGRKVCGILVESRKPSASLESVVIVGVGINVNTQEFPQSLADKATSMAMEAGQTVSRGMTERMFLDAFKTRYEQYLAEGFRPILSAWKHLDCTVGRDVMVQTSEGVVEGTAIEVNTRGNLIVHCLDGSHKEIAAGEVLFPG